MILCWLLNLYINGCIYVVVCLLLLCFLWKASIQIGVGHRGSVFDLVLPSPRRLLALACAAGMHHCHLKHLP